VGQVSIWFDGGSPLQSWGSFLTIREGKQGEMLADFSRLSNEEWEAFKVLNAKIIVKKEGEPTPILTRDHKVYGS